MGQTAIIALTVKTQDAGRGKSVREHFKRHRFQIGRWRPQKVTTEEWQRPEELWQTSEAFFDRLDDASQAVLGYAGDDIGGRFQFGSFHEHGQSLIYYYGEYFTLLEHVGLGLANQLYQAIHADYLVIAWELEPSDIIDFVRGQDFEDAYQYIRVALGLPSDLLDDYLLDDNFQFEGLKGYSFNPDHPEYYGG